MNDCYAELAYKSEKQMFLMRKAMKLQVYIPMLSYMEYDVIWREEELIKLIKKVMGDEPKTCEELCEWVESLYSIGDRVNYWSINFFNHVANNDKIWTNKEKEKLHMINEKLAHCTDEEERKKYRQERDDEIYRKKFVLAGEKMKYVNKYAEWCESHGFDTKAEKYNIN